MHQVQDLSLLALRGRAFIKCPSVSLAPEEMPGTEQVFNKCWWINENLSFHSANAFRIIATLPAPAHKAPDSHRHFCYPLGWRLPLCLWPSKGLFSPGSRWLPALLGAMVVENQ